MKKLAISEQGQQVTRRERVHGRKICIDDVRPRGNSADAPILNGVTLADTLSVEERVLIEERVAANSQQRVETQPVEEKKMSTKKKVIIGVSIAASVAIVGGLIWGCRPLQDGVPCERSLVRADGKPKVCYATNLGARLKALWDTIYFQDGKMVSYKIVHKDGTVGKYNGHAKKVS